MKYIFHIDHKDLDKETVLIELDGYLNLDTYIDLKNTFDRLLSAGKKKYLVNCGKLKRISSSGVHCFVYLTKNLGNNNSVKLYNVSPEIKRVFNALELIDMFGCVDTYEEAYALLSN